MSTSDFARKVFKIVAESPEVNRRSLDFEMAYQARVAVDRIKFAIKQAEQFAPRTDQMREVELQLLDAPERLEKVERRFQEISRLRTVDRCETEILSRRHKRDGKLCV